MSRSRNASASAEAAGTVRAMTRNTRRVAVEPVHQTRPLFAPEPQLVEQRVYAFRDARPALAREAGGLFSTIITSSMCRIASFRSYFDFAGATSRRGRVSVAVESIGGTRTIWPRPAGRPPWRACRRVAPVGAQELLEPPMGEARKMPLEQRSRRMPPSSFATVFC